MLIVILMARATRVDFPGAWCHVLNRGAERRAIFRSKRCCEKFIQLLSGLPERFGVRLHGYALMGNHYHLQLESREANLSKAVHWLNVSYSVWFNRRGALEALTWTQIVRAVNNVWDEPWEELLTARGTGARQTALFIGRIRGRLRLKELGRLAGGIHHNAVGIAIRRFTQRLRSDRTLLEKVALVQKELELR
jgi:REP element-mobilizing transposase RayT